MKDNIESMTDEELQSKKDFIINCIQLGMGFDKACIVAEIPKESIKQLREDSDLIRDIEVQEADHERRLLEKYNLVIDEAINRGNSKPLEWMLGIVNPERYSPKADVVPITGSLVITKDDKNLI